MSRSNRVLSCLLVLGLFVTSTVAHAEALPSPTMLALFYRMAKANAKPEAAEEIAAVDAALAEAQAAGRVGEVRRQLARGLTLARQMAWSDQADFDASLVARADETFADSARGVTVRVSQVFPSTMTGSRDLEVTASLHEPAPRGFGVGPKLTDLGVHAHVGLDLIENPFVVRFAPESIDAGDYALQLSFAADGEVLGTATTPLHVRDGLDGRVAALRASARAADDPEASASIRYPIDVMRKVDAGAIATRGVDIDAELAAAADVAAAVGRGENPFAGRTGDFERHYYSESAGEILPYRVFVPSTYSDTEDHPLVVALHGLGGTEDSMFNDRYGMKPLAEEGGYLMVAPLGYRDDGGYGASLGGPPSRRGMLSEQDVLDVLTRIERDYAIDKDRIFLMGHSMGAIGTWAIAAKYPERWAALGPIAGFGNPITAGAIKNIPQVVVHGDNDRTVPVTGSRGMVTALEAAGARVNYIEVPGGGHTDVAYQHMADIFAFFDEI